MVSGNLTYDRATDIDQDGTWPNGIEGWGERQVTSGNTIANVAGSCIFVGGRGQRNTDNVCTGAGKRSDGAGAPAIQIGYVSATQNGSSSCLLHNRCGTTAPEQLTFGLSDQAGVVGVYAPSHANAFAGAPVRVLGAPAATREPLC